MIKKTKNWEKIITDLLKVRSPHRDKFHPEEFKRLEKKVMSLLPSKNIKHQNKIPLITKKMFLELTTARNRNLVNFAEQNQLRETVVAFFGLSVGFQAVTSWGLLSRADQIIVVDPDIVSSTNLNRLPFGWDDLGRLKTDVTVEKVRTINPYCQVTKQEDISPLKIKHLFQSEKINFVVDEIDDLSGKVLLRSLCEKNGIPLLSAADVGDNVVLDVERYDKEPTPEPFLGRIPNSKKIDFSKITASEKRNLIINLVGFEENSEKMLDSLMAIGGSIPTWPQLGPTAAIAGGIVATTIKKIALGEKVKGGRYYFSLDSILDASFSEPKNIKIREEKINTIRYVLSKNENI